MGLTLDIAYAPRDYNAASEHARLTQHVATCGVRGLFTVCIIDSVLSRYTVLRDCSDVWLHRFIERQDSAQLPVEWARFMSRKEMLERFEKKNCQFSYGTCHILGNVANKRSSLVIHYWRSLIGHISSDWSIHRYLKYFATCRTTTKRYYIVLLFN